MLQKCLLVAYDGTESSLACIPFLRRLYPGPEDLKILLCHLLPPLPPLFREPPDSPGMMARRERAIHAHKAEAEAALLRARTFLARAGFPEDAVEVHVREREASIGAHACHMAEVAKVDALVMAKFESGWLDSLFQGDPHTEFLRHCIRCPAWFVEGNPEPAHAAVCLNNEAAFLRALDHAAFMLEGTATRITFLHVSPDFRRRFVNRGLTPDPILMARARAQGRAEKLAELLSRSRNILEEHHIDPASADLALLPGEPEEAIIPWCRENDVGIVVLGHSKPTGAWSFLEGSVTAAVLREFRDMAVWVNQ